MKFSAQTVGSPHKMTCIFLGGIFIGVPGFTDVGLNFALRFEKKNSQLLQLLPILLLITPVSASIPCTKEHDVSVVILS